MILNLINLFLPLQYPFLNEDYIFISQAGLLLGSEATSIISLYTEIKNYLFIEAIFLGITWIALSIQIKTFFKKTFDLNFNLFLIIFLNIIYLQDQINKNIIHLNKSLKNTFTSFNEEISQKELTVKNYIEQYKSQYSREKIKIALMETEIQEKEVENYLKKYFN